MRFTTRIKVAVGLSVLAVGTYLAVGNAYAAGPESCPPWIYHWNPNPVHPELQYTWIQPDTGFLFGWYVGGGSEGPYDCTNGINYIVD